MHDAVFFQKYAVGGYLGDLFDSMPGFLYFVKDAELRFVALNRRLAERLGVRDPSGILGLRDSDCMSPHLADAYRKDDMKVIGKRVAIINKVELVTRGNGLVDWSTTTKTPLVDDSGTVRGIVGVTRPFQSGISGLEAEESLGAAVKLMKDRCTENITVRELARLANVSVSAFERNFKKNFGMTPKQYMRHLRVQAACHKLVQTNNQLADIACGCGYSDQSHFTREFVRVMRETPRSYRMRYRV